MNLTIGKVNGTPYAVDTEVLRRSHLLITGVSGAGKSYRLRVLAESLAPIMPVLIIDPEGEYYTLREKFPFLLFGEDGDAPMAVSTAALAATSLLGWKASGIFDLSGLEIDQQHQWVRDFINGLMHAPRELWGPTAILLDEAHLWAPEKGEQNSYALNAVKNLCARARKRGFFVVLATQRPAKLSNSCASEMQNYLIGRTTLPADRDTAARFLGITTREKGEFFNQVKGLKDHVFFGQGIAISPDRLLLSPIEAQTTHIRPGEIREVVPATPENIRELMPQLATLKTSAAHGTHGTQDGDQRKRIEELTAQRESLAIELASLRAALSAFVERGASLLGQLGEEMGALGGATTAAPLALPPAPEKPVTRAAPEPRPARTDGLSQRHIQALTALRSAELAGVPHVPRPWLAAAAAVSARSSTYQRTLSFLESYDYIRFPGSGVVALADKGREVVAADPDPPKLTTDRILEAMGRTLDPVPFAIIRNLVTEEGGNWTPTERVAEYAGQSPRSSTFQGHLSDLRRMGYLERSGKGTFRVNDWIYLDARQETRA